MCCAMMALAMAIMDTLKDDTESSSNTLTEQK